MHRGRVVFGAMDEVVFGDAAAAALVAQMDRLSASRAFLMVSGTLNRQTDEIEKIRDALAARFAGLFDAMPQHTPREAESRSIWATSAAAAPSPNTTSSMAPKTTRPLCTLVLPVNWFCF